MPDLHTGHCMFSGEGVTNLLCLSLHREGRVEALQTILRVRKLSSSTGCPEVGMVAMSPTIGAQENKSLLWGWLYYKDPPSRDPKNSRWPSQDFPKEHPDTAA